MKWLCGRIRLMVQLIATILSTCILRTGLLHRMELQGPCRYWVTMRRLSENKDSRSSNSRCSPPKLYIRFWQSRFQAFSIMTDWWSTARDQSSPPESITQGGSGWKKSGHESGRCTNRQTSGERILGEEEEIEDGEHRKPQHLVWGTLSQW